MHAEATTQEGSSMPETWSPSQRAENRWKRALSAEGAAIAGIVFGILSIVAVVLFRSEPGSDASPDEIAAWLASDDAADRPITGLYLLSFAVIALLWFIGVIRRRVGRHEDKFFATVFLGSGLLMGGLLVVGSTLLAAPALIASNQGANAIDVADYVQLRSLGEALFAIHGVRVGAVFVFTTSTVVLRAGVFPKWLAVLGYLAGLAMLVDPLQLLDLFYVFPAWVIIVSIFMLLRRTKIPVQAGASPPPGAR